MQKPTYEFTDLPKPHWPSLWPTVMSPQGRGRPRSGRGTMLRVHADHALLVRFDKARDTLGLSRPAMLRRLVVDGLDRLERPPRMPGCTGEKP